MVLLWLRTLSATMTVVISPNYWIVLVMVGLVRLQTDLDPARILTHHQRSVVDLDSPSRRCILLVSW